MSPLPSNTLLERRRIAAVGQHRGVVIRLKNHGITGLVTGFNMGRNTTQISQYSQAEPGKFKNKLRRLTRVMGDSYRPDRETINFKGSISVNQSQVGKFTQGTAVESSGSHVDRDLIAARQCCDTLDMIRVLMGNKNGGELFWPARQTKQTLLGLLQAEATVDEQCTRSPLHQSGIPTTATAQRCKTHSLSFR